MSIMLFARIKSAIISFPGYQFTVDILASHATLSSVFFFRRSFFSLQNVFKIHQEKLRNYGVVRSDLVFRCIRANISSNARVESILFPQDFPPHLARAITFKWTALTSGL
jgi:hypothetical protein